VIPIDADTSIEQVAGLVSEALTSAGITAVLSGGAAVQIYTSGLYPSRDLDFVSPAGHREIEAVLRPLGYVRLSGRHFVHPTCPFTLEFPAWPLAVGREPLGEWGTRRVGSLRIQMLTPTQCVMDRLAAYFHWRDRQALDQAVAVASSQTVDLETVERWSASEGHGAGFLVFLEALTLNGRDD